MGQESLAFAAMSALLCSDADELACLDVGAYNGFKHGVDNPKGYYIIWALASMARQGCTTPDRPCAGDGVPFGMTVGCEACVARGLGWCDYAYMVDVNETITATTPRFAAMCVDPSVFSSCIYTSGPPYVNCDDR